MVVSSSITSPFLEKKRPLFSMNLNIIYTFFVVESSKGKKFFSPKFNKSLIQI